MCSFLFLAKYCSNTVNEKQGLQYFWCVPSFVQVWNLQNISPTSFFFRSMKAFLWGRSSGTDTQWGSRSGLLWQPGLVFTLAWRDHSPEVAPDEHICQCPCLAWPPLDSGEPHGLLLTSAAEGTLPDSWDYVTRRLMACGGSHLPWWPRCEEATSPVGGFLGLGPAPRRGAERVSEAPSSVSSPAGPSDDSNSSYRKFRPQLPERSTIKISQQIQLAHER